MPDALWERARSVMPGGVSSPVRAYGAVGGDPFFAADASGARVRTEDGRTLIDMIGSWGPLILGHAHPAVVEAVTQAAAGGTTFGIPTRREVELAEAIVASVDSIDMVRLVSSGTEAAMSAVRLARAASGRDGIVKFAGCYHGHSDAMLVQAGSGVATFGLPESPGVTPGAAVDTIVARYNDASTVASAFALHQIGAVIVEPVGANMGVVPPADGFLQSLRNLCDAGGALLIFDEVVTGFRLARGGAQAVYGVKPDLTVLGKVVGGGLPLAAYGGSRDLMSRIAPAGDVYQAGTLAGNPLATAAGLATLALLDDDAYARLDEAGRMLEHGLRSAAAEAGATVTINRVGSMLTVFFTDGPVTDFDSARRTDAKRFARFFHALLREGVAWPPSPFEAAFVSLAHTPGDIGAVIAAARFGFQEAR
ncbi:MAG TPA: glutamate-1-semialdehyde 2,1-aminomutase [Actinomycetota bacterium]|nr:glutamate-1-semialdehyde 2,1-aminomutase [Actinomycetota bacterium]